MSNPGKRYLTVEAAGSVVTVRRYPDGVWCGFNQDNRGRNKGDPMGPRGTLETRRMIRQLVTTNFSAGDKFVTLTFRDGAVSDYTDVQECNAAFGRFRKRARRRWPDFKYLAVIEFQDGNGRGAVHYHMLCNLPYVPADELAEVWAYGYIHVNRIDHVDHLGAYVVKYMTGDTGDPRLKGQKAYLVPKGLDRPSVLHGDDAQRVIDAYGLGDSVKEAWTKAYELPEVAGGSLVLVADYNLNRPQGGIYARKG